MQRIPNDRQHLGLWRRIMTLHSCLDEDVNAELSKPCPNTFGARIVNGYLRGVDEYYGDVDWGYVRLFDLGDKKFLDKSRRYKISDTIPHVLSLVHHVDKPIIVPHERIPLQIRHDLHASDVPYEVMQFELPGHTGYRVTPDKELVISEATKDSALVEFLKTVDLQQLVE